MSAPVLGSIPTLVTSWFCPYAQRTLIALNAKKGSLPFQIHEVSHEELYAQKLQWLLDLNPSGRVPFLAWKEPTASSSSSSNSSRRYAATTAAGSEQQGITVITESLVINEYVDDACPSPPLLPADAVGRAAARLLIRRIEDQVVPAFKQLIENFRHIGPEQAAAAERLDAAITDLLQQYHPDGPFALSDQLSLVDCAVAPHFLRLYILQHYAEYRYKGPHSDRLRQYIKALKQSPAVAGSCYHSEGLDFRQELLRKYAHYGVTMAYKNVKPLW